MNILIIISQFSPAQTPNTLRWLPLAQRFISEGHQVSILTTKRRGIDEESIIDGISIYRAGYNTLMDRIYDLFNRKVRRNEEGYDSAGAGVGTAMVQGLANMFWRNSYWPDGSKLFLMPGIKMGEEVISKQKIDKVISVGLPFTSHWIAKHLKEKHPSLHWVMDIQDPFCYSKEFRVNNFEKYHKKNVAAEGEAFKLADQISITNQRAKEKYQEYFSEYIHKVKVIPPLYNEKKRDAFYDMILYSQKIHIGYFGSFYEGVRSPKIFLDFIYYIWKKDKALLSKFQFHFIGQIDRETEAIFAQYVGIRRCFVLHGFMNRDKTLSAMEQVDFLLNFGNSTDYHLPSKVVDYLSMNKPVVNISSIDEDSTKGFFSSKDIPFLDLKLEEKNFEMQSKILLDFLHAEHACKDSRSMMESYTLTPIAGAYMALLDGSALDKS